MFSNNKRFTRSALALAAVAVSATGAAFAQSTTQGAIGGTVYDPASSVVAQADVVVHNNGTNAELKLKSDGSGFFKIPLLEPGYYTVTVTALGFSTYKSPNVQVVVGELTQLQARLATGSETTTVEVSAEAPILNFDSPDFTTTLNQRALEDVPVNNLRWSSLALTTPGVVSDSNGFGLVSIRGISPLLNNVLIDGADDNQAYYSEERGRTREAYSTPPEAIREFNVNAGVYSAEFGRAAGGVINSVTKSGSNQIHGVGYFMDRESAWGAYNPFTTNTTGVQNAATGVYSFTTAPYKPIDSRKIWGFTAGGAIIHDKLFWQYTYDQHHRNFPGTAKAAVPGTFFAQPDANLPTGATCNVATGYLTGTTTTNTNYVLDASACTLAARTGLLTYAAGVTAYGNGLASLLPDLGSVPRTGDQLVNMPKLDYQINNKNNVTLLYNRLRWDSPGGVQTQATNAYAIDSFGTDFVKLDYGVAKLNSVITSSISNELLYQYGRELNDEGQQPLSSYTKQNLTGTAGPGGPVNYPEVALATSTGFILGSPYYSYRKALPDERKWQIGDTLYLSRGNHSIKIGLDSVHNYDLINNTFESNGVITYSYIGNFFADVANEGKSNDTCVSGATQYAPSATVSAIGLFPCYSTVAQGFGNPIYATQTFDYGVFLQDNWKFRPRLTLQLGIRYDQELMPNNPVNNNLTSIVPSTVAGAANFFTPYAGINNAPSDKNNFGPRLGFAFDVFGTGKTVLRGGYGMFYGRITNGILLNSLLSTGSPNGQTTISIKSSTFCNNTTVTCTGTNTPQNVAQVLPNILPATFTGTPPKASSYYLDAHLQNPMVHEFDMTVQQELGRGAVLSASYLGALGRELTNFVDTNLAAPTQTTTITFVDSTGKSPVANGTVVTLPVYTAYVNNNFSTITAVKSNINSSYNALVFEFQNKSAKTIQFDLNYTWSHALDYGQNAQTTTTSNNQYDPNGSQRKDYGNSNNNVPNRFTGYVLYNLPIRHTKGFVDYFINDWSLNSAFQAQSGLPYTASIASGFASTPALNGGFNGAGGTTFIPLPGLGRNTYKFKRDLVQDFRIQKLAHFTERVSGEARLDVFNIYNHQNYTAVNSGAYILGNNTPTGATATYQSAFGTYTNSNSSGFLYTPRQVQIGFRLLF